MATFARDMNPIDKVLGRSHRRAGRGARNQLARNR